MSAKVRRARVVRLYVGSHTVLFPRANHTTDTIHPVQYHTRSKHKNVQKMSGKCPGTFSGHFSDIFLTLNAHGEAAAPSGRLYGAENV